MSASLSFVPSFAAVVASNAAPETPSPSSVPPAPPSGVAVRGQVSPSSPRLTSSAVPRARFTPDAPPAPLRASQVRTIAAKELDWFFASTETNTDNASVAARAAIASWLDTLPPSHQEVIELRYSPEPWPYWLSDDWKSGFALARSMVSTRTRRSFARVHLEMMAKEETENLEAAIERHGAGVMRGIEKCADRDFSAALRSYANARGRSPSVVPPGGSQ